MLVDVHAWHLLTVCWNGLMTVCRSVRVWLGVRDSAVVCGLAPMGLLRGAGFRFDGAGKGTRTPVRFHVAVFETAALPLGYPGTGRI